MTHDTPEWFESTLSEGSTSWAVQVIRRKLGISEEGHYDTSVTARVRGFQLQHNLYPSGEVDAATATALGRTATYGMVPSWFTREVRYGLAGPDVQRLRAILTYDDGDLFSGGVERKVRQWQSARAMPTTGVVDQAMAIMLGD